ncbi:hypothetical protein RB597_003636 [Gaeumannomyces tritici]
MRNPPASAGTCNWVTDSETFKQWHGRDSARFLLVTAKPECGKSVLARHLIDEFLPRVSGDDSSICYFFFKDDADDQKSVSKALCCILHQLFSDKRHLITRKTINAFLASGSDGRFFLESFSNLWKTFTEAVEQPDAGSVFCILDVLDECNSNEQSRLAEALSRYYKAPSINSNLKVLLTSHPYQHIKQPFQSLKRSVPDTHLCGGNDEEQEQISQEIDLFIEEEVGQLDLEQQVHRTVCSTPKAEKSRTYLWARLIVPELRDAIGTSEELLLEVIETLLRTVPDVYEKILSKSRSPAMTRRILQIVVVAFRPLTITEMKHALGSRYANETDASFTRTLENLCGFFLDIKSSKIYLIHQTAKDFLLVADAAALTPGIWKESLRIRHSHHTLADICVQYLEDLEYPQVPGHLQHSHPFDGWRGRLDSDQLAQNHGFFQYATVCWAGHYIVSRQLDSLALSRLQKSLCNPAWPPSIVCLMAALKYLNLAPTCRRYSHRPPVTSLGLFSFYGVAEGVTAALDQAQLQGQDIDLSALSYATITGFNDIVAEQLYRGREHLTREHASGALWIAVANRHEKIAELLLLAGKASPDLRNNKGDTPLHQAVMGGNREMTELLLSTGKANPDLVDNQGDTPLHKAVIGRNRETVELLLSAGRANPDVGDNRGSTPLFSAVLNWDVEMVTVLLETGKANPDLCGSHGAPPIAFAVDSGNRAMVKLLLQAGRANPDITFGNGMPVLTYARSKGDAAIIQLLQDAQKARMGEP